MRKSLSRINTLLSRNIKEIIREPISLIFAVGLPLVLEVIFYFLFHELASQFEIKYLAPGIVIFSESFLTLFTGILISTDRSTSFLTRLYVSKTKPYEFILSYVLAIVPISLFQTILFFAVGGIIDPSIFNLRTLLAIPLSIITSILFISLGILFGSICNEKSIGGISSIIICGQSILSGMWFPIEDLSSGVLIFMKVLPFRNATMLLENGVNNMINNSFNDFWCPLIIVLGYSVVSFILAVFCFKKNMKEK